MSNSNLGLPGRSVPRARGGCRRGVLIALLALLVCAIGSLVVYLLLPRGPTVATGGKPSVAITAPASGSQFREGEDVTVQSIATDSTGVVRVELLADGVTVRIDSSPNPQGQPSLALLQTWKATPGTHTLTVRAFNAAGAVSDPVAISISVSQAAANATMPPPTATPPTMTLPTPTPSPTPSALPPTTESPFGIASPTPAVPTPQSQPQPQPQPQPDTQGPPPPVIVSPKDNQRLACVAVITLVWNAPSDPSGIANYSVSLSTVGGDGGTQAAWNQLTTTQLNVSQHTSCGNSYRWRVFARDGAGNEGQKSDWAYFSINLPPSPTPDRQGPPAPVIVSPKDYRQLSCVAVITLVWNVPSDPSGIANYRVRLQKRGGADYVDQKIWDPVTTTQVSASAETDCGNWYRWRLFARDGAGNQGEVSDWAYFSILRPNQ